MPNTISNSDDLIDSRDVIARIKALTDLNELDGEQAVELAALQTLADESAACSAGWEFGETLIRDSYLKTYAQQNRTSVTFDGVEYWIR